MGSRNRHKNRYGVSRPSQIRRPLPVVVVVCDDTKTAVAYFTEVKREVKEKVTVQVEPSSSCGASPEAMFKQADNLKKSQNQTRSQKDDIHDSIWVLIDWESEPHQQNQAKQVKKKEQGSGLRVVQSNPCFEVWTLAHLVDTGETFKDCGAVLARLKKEWKKKFKTEFSPKAQVDYSKLMPHRNEAVQRSKNRNPKSNQSWTEVYKVVEAITLLVSNDQP